MNRRNLWRWATERVTNEDYERLMVVIARETYGRRWLAIEYDVDGFMSAVEVESA